jgi:hypothetical protein
VNNPQNKILALDPHRLVSLWDMIQLIMRDFEVLQRLKSVWGQLEELQKNNPTGTPTEDERKKLTGLLHDTNRLWVIIDLIGDVYLVTHLEHQLNHQPYKNYSDIAGSLRMIILKTQNELEVRSFAYIPFDKGQYFEQEMLYGTSVYRACSIEINAEIKAAGNCLAVNLNTAAIFHLMRVAEFGMRALARHLKVKVKRNTIDSAGWTEIINQIEEATAGRWKKLPKAKKVRKQATDFLKFCEVAADELNVFKEIWRNNVMHASGSYKPAEALYVFDRVKDFMQRLAERISLQ